MISHPSQIKLLVALVAQAISISVHAEEPVAKGTAIETVTIDAQRTSTAVARSAQKEAGNIINLMTAEEMRKLPDVNIAEAVRHIPGVSLETDTGEGRYINIRGLDSDLNSTTFGGLRLPPSNNASPFGGGRAVALDAIPTGLVGAITVTKTNLPEQDAEALGGTVEITPKTAPRSGKLFGEARIGTGREPLRGTNITDLSFSGGGRFGFGEAAKGSRPGIDSYSDKPFSLVVTGAYYEDKRGIDDVEPGFIDDGVNSPYAYAGWDQRYYQYNRKRHGVGIDLGYQPDANNSYYVRAFDAGYTETVMRNRLIVTPDGNPVATANGFTDGMTANGFDKTLRQEKERINNQVFVIGGKNKIDEKNLDYRIGFTHGSYEKLYDYNSDFNFTPASATINYNNNGEGHTPLFFVNGADYLNPANYALQKFQNSTTDIQDKEYSTAMNLKMPVKWGGFDSESVKFGVSARLRKREASGQPYTFSNVPAVPLTSASTGANLSFYNGQYQNGPQLSPDYLQNLLAGQQTITAKDRSNAALQYQVDKEDVYATYAQYQMVLGQWSVIGGVRYENTRANYAANANVRDAAGNTSITPIANDSNYRNFFPGIQGRYEIDPSTIVRLAYSSTIARPGFNQVSPSLNVNIGANTVSQGNPNLKPSTADSFDFSIEKYLPNSGIISLGLYDKELKDYIASSQTSQVFPNNGLFAGFTGPAHVYSYSNVGKSRAYGVELNYEQRFKQLPDLWSGLGAGMNYTYVHSRFEIRPGEFSTLPSTSKNTANATLFYEKGRVNMRLGAYYVSRNLWAIGGNGVPDVFSEPRTSLDFGSSYAIADNTSVYFNAKNMTNTALKFAEGASNRTIQREYYGKTFQVGLNLTY